MEAHQASQNLRDYLHEHLPGRVSAAGWFNTPCISPDHVDSNPSFGVNLRTGSGKCLACQYRPSLTEIIQRIEVCSPVEAAIRASRLQLEQGWIGADVGPRPTAPERFSKHHSYWRGRGLRESTVLRYGLGYDPKKRRVFAPAHYPDGTLAGYIERSIDEKRYFNDEGLPKSQLLIAYHQLKRPAFEIHIPEGPIDTYVLNQEGFVSTGRIGLDISEIQLRLIRGAGAELVWMVIDNDAYALREGDRAAKLGFGIAHVPLPFKDPGEMLEKAGRVELVKIPPLVWKLSRLHG